MLDIQMISVVRPCQTLLKTMAGALVPVIPAVILRQAGFPLRFVAGMAENLFGYSGYYSGVGPC